MPTTSRRAKQKIWSLHGRNTPIPCPPTPNIGNKTKISTTIWKQTPQNTPWHRSGRVHNYGRPQYDKNGPIPPNTTKKFELADVIEEKMSPDQAKRTTYKWVPNKLDHLLASWNLLNERSDVQYGPYEDLNSHRIPIKVHPLEKLKRGKQKVETL